MLISLILTYSNLFGHSAGRGKFWQDCSQSSADLLKEHIGHCSADRQGIQLKSFLQGHRTQTASSLAGENTSILYIMPPRPQALHKNLLSLHQTHRLQNMRAPGITRIQLVSDKTALWHISWKHIQDTQFKQLNHKFTNPWEIACWYNVDTLSAVSQTANPEAFQIAPRFRAPSSSIYQ